MSEDNTPDQVDPNKLVAGRGGSGRFGSMLIDKLPQWFAVLVGLVYGTGFLIVFCFADYIGIRGAVVEGLKAKYIHVGLLCLQFPLSAGLALLTASFMLRKAKQSGEKEEVIKDRSPAQGERDSEHARKRKVLEALAMAAFSIVLLLFFYLFSTFARPGHFSEHEYAIALFFLLVFVGAMVMAWQRGQFLASWRIKKKFLDLWSVEIRWLLVLVLFIQTVLVFASLRGLLWEMLKLGGYMYFLLLFLIGEFVWRLKGRFDSDKGSGLFPTYAVMTLTVCSAFFYLSVLCFAYRVYPYIPVAKGGGDYTDEPMCVLKFDEKYEKSIPRDIIDLTQPNSLQSKPLMLIDETDNRMFIAERSATNNPVEWRKPGHLSKPRILTIRREAITSVEYVR